MSLKIGTSFFGGLAGRELMELLDKCNETEFSIRSGGPVIINLSTFKVRPVRFAVALAGLACLSAVPATKCRRCLPPGQS